MKLREIVEALDLRVQIGAVFLDREAKGGYVSDMLSDVLKHASEGDVWVTVQIHLNVMAIAGMKELAGIIIVNGRQPDEETLEKANEEKIPVLGTEMNASQVVGKLYQLGLNAQDENISR